jgi:hypothetical protein
MNISKAEINFFDESNECTKTIKKCMIKKMTTTVHYINIIITIFSK